MESNLIKAYEEGKELALDTMTKEAMLSSILKGGKFLFTGGHLGKPGSFISRLSPHHLGAPLGGGLFGAYTAEEGEKAKGFVKGVAGGLLFNAAMPIGMGLGKRIMAPGFSGAGSTKIMKGIGYSDEATAAMRASQNINKALNTKPGSMLNPLNLFKGVTERALSSGNFKFDPRLAKSLEDVLKQQNKLIPDALKTRIKNLTFKLNSPGGVAAKNQAKVLEELRDISSQLYKGGYSTGSLGQRMALKGTRFAKGVGMMGGGIGLGYALQGPMENALDSSPASYFNSTGGR